MTHEKDAAAIVERLIEEYDRSVSALRGALKTFLTTGERPDPALRADGAFVYPELQLHWGGENGYPRISRAYARGSAAPTPASACPATTRRRSPDRRCSANIWSSNWP